MNKPEGAIAEEYFKRQIEGCKRVLGMDAKELWSTARASIAKDMNDAEEALADVVALDGCRMNLESEMRSILTYTGFRTLEDLVAASADQRDTVCFGIAELIHEALGDRIDSTTDLERGEL